MTQPTKRKKKKRQGNYGKNLGKTYMTEKKKAVIASNEPDQKGSTTKDDFDIDKINVILEKNQIREDLKDPKEEAKKAEAEIDYITIDNDPDKDPDEEVDPEPEPKKDPEPEPKKEKDYNLRDTVTADMLIDGLEYLSYKGATAICERTNKTVLNATAAKYTENERKGMRPGAEKMLDALLNRIDDKPIAAMVGIAVLHTIAVVMMSGKNPPAENPEPKTDTGQI